MKRENQFSKDRKYRYALWRYFETPHNLLKEYSVTRDHDGFVMFIGLNPSTADETKDDPTLRRCIDFARRWGYRELCMTNLFGLRATNPRELKKVTDPLGAENDVTLLRIATKASLIICAWGMRTYSGIGDRDKVVLTMLTKFQLQCLGVNSDGSPMHPLYIPADRQPVPYLGLR
jgi:hypothetical protein